MDIMEIKITCCKVKAMPEDGRKNRVLGVGKLGTSRESKKKRDMIMPPEISVIKYPSHIFPFTPLTLRHDCKRTSLIGNNVLLLMVSLLVTNTLSIDDIYKINGIL